MSGRVKKKRPYRSAVRQEQAARTRARILQAAGELFASEGYARTTVRAVAEHAGVAVDTVYATFGNKARVLTALIDDRLSGGAAVANVLEIPQAQAIRDEADQRRQIERFAWWVAATSARVRPLYEILRTASAVEPDVAAIHQEMDRYRLQNMRTVVAWFTARGALRMPAERAAQTIWTLASPDVGRMLCDDLGWSRDAYAEWLDDALARSLLGGG